MIHMSILYTSLPKKQLLRTFSDNFFTDLFFLQCFVIISVRCLKVFLKPRLSLQLRQDIHMIPCHFFRNLRFRDLFKTFQTFLIPVICIRMHTPVIINSCHTSGKISSKFISFSTTCRSPLIASLCNPFRLIKIPLYPQKRNKFIIFFQHPHRRIPKSLCQAQNRFHQSGIFPVAPVPGFDPIQLSTQISDKTLQKKSAVGIGGKKLFPDISCYDRMDPYIPLSVLRLR